MSSDNIKMNFLGNICGDGYDKLLIAEKTGPNNPYQIYCYSYNEVLTSTEPVVSSSFSLSQNYPNPANPTTTISYEIPEAQNIKLQIFDISGRLVETLYSGYKETGYWQTKWNAGNQSSGIYIYRLEYGNKHISRKMLLLK
ncbi:MAG: T9SS type A sorting domain-containing protein [Candidatus Marinimicrobia bacterium]|nr:T9SS type A sorting domain-containing protein [Candidatus Neomarinimicrobiota bacterium]